MTSGQVPSHDIGPLVQLPGLTESHHVSPSRLPHVYETGTGGGPCGIESTWQTMDTSAACIPTELFLSESLSMQT